MNPINTNLVKEIGNMSLTPLVSTGISGCQCKRAGSTFPARQRGALTIVSAALILALMTALVIYGTQVGLFETKVSGNELRHKQAFNAAEAAVDQGMMYALSNRGRLLSARTNVFPDGAGGFTGDGWFDAGNPRWGTCTATEVALDDHPCGGDVPMPVGAFFYDTDGDSTTVESLPVDNSRMPANTTARLSAVLCFVDLDDPAGGCGAVPATAEDESVASLVVWMLGYGYSDCNAVNLATATGLDAACTGKATVAKPISNYSNLSGAPAVPLVAKTAFPPSGTFEVVGNPNGGGIGVPLTVWANNNTAQNCGPATPILDSGTWQTCEYEEWYHQSEYPDGVACTDNNCFCGSGGNNTDQFLSWRTANDTNIGVDIVIDPNFPCDLFEFYFGVPKDQYHLIKNNAQIIDDCDSLGPGSSGLIWVTGSTCNINANTTVGSPDSPVALISAASSTVINGGATVFGVLYVFDGEDADAELEVKGGGTVYGAVIVDAKLEKAQGTMQVVHANGVLTRASGIGSIGAVNGGWRDFGLPDVAW